VPTIAFKVVAAKCQLFEFVFAIRPTGSLAGLLNGGQQQADQNGNDGNHYQQLDQCEAMTIYGTRLPGQQGTFKTLHGTLTF
jgi:hypothetical protein